MTRPSPNGAGPRRRGGEYERELVAYLRDNGHPHAARAYGQGRPDDLGDIVGVPWTMQAKATKELRLAEALDDAATQAARRPVYAPPLAVFKRRGKPVGQSYVVMTLETLCELGLRSSQPLPAAPIAP